MFSRVFYYRPGAADWMAFGGRVDLASSVHCMMAEAERLFIGTGHVYGNVYTCSFDRLTAVEETVQKRPRTVVVKPSYPNPFNPETVLSYFLPEQGPVRLDIYDVSGRLVRTLEQSQASPAGWHAARWDGHDGDGRSVASGVYFYKLQVGSVVKSGKMTLLK
jgi:hypothetical protein